jgi:hypothetical protein
VLKQNTYSKPGLAIAARDVTRTARIEHAQDAREQPRVVGHRPPVIVTGKTRRAIIARTSIFGHNASSFSVSDDKKKHQETAHTY